MFAVGLTFFCGFCLGTIPFSYRAASKLIDQLTYHAVAVNQIANDQAEALVCLQKVNDNNDPQ